MNAFVTEQKIQAASDRKVPQYADYIYCIGDKALVFSEKPGKWISSFTVIFVDRRRITVSTTDGAHKYFFNTFYIKPYFRNVNFQ